VKNEKIPPKENWKGQRLTVHRPQQMVILIRSDVLLELTVVCGLSTIDKSKLTVVRQPWTVDCY
jgi:hypothetical protein